MYYLIVYACIYIYIFIKANECCRCLSYTKALGMSAPSLHRECTDSLNIYMTAYHMYTYSNYRHILFMFVTTLGLGGWEH